MQRIVRGIIYIFWKRCTDKIKMHKFLNIIFIANRLSNRGLSYVSSDYNRHLTCQITRIRSNVTSFFQSLRILGIYNSKRLINLELVIPDHEQKLFEKHLQFFKSFDIKDKLYF